MEPSAGIPSSPSCAMRSPIAAVDKSRAMCRGIVFHSAHYSALGSFPTLEPLYNGRVLCVWPVIDSIVYAECQVPKLDVAGSIPVSRSISVFRERLAWSLSSRAK
jgi:hypothetical protein